MRAVLGLVLLLEGVGAKAADITGEMRQRAIEVLRPGGGENIYEVYFEEGAFDALPCQKRRYFYVKVDDRSDNGFMPFAPTLTLSLCVRFYEIVERYPEKMLPAEVRWNQASVSVYTRKHLKFRWSRGLSTVSGSIYRGWYWSRLDRSLDATRILLPRDYE